MLLLLLWVSGNSSASAKEGQGSSHLLVSFASGERMVLGLYYRPPGEGPFPALIFNHAVSHSLMDVDASGYEELARYFNSRGYILFVPDRRPPGIPKSEFSKRLRKQLEETPDAPSVKDLQAVEKAKIINVDIVAAVEWLKKQPEVDTNRIAMMGLFYGGVQTLVAAPKNTGIRAAIAVSPAVTTWNDGPAFRTLLLDAVRNSKSPIFLIFAENNQSLTAAAALGAETSRKGQPNRMKIYPAFGKTADDARGFVQKGVNIWGPDVMKFLAETLN